MKLYPFTAKVVAVTVSLCFLLLSCESSSGDTGTGDEFIRATVETISFTSSSAADAVTAVKIETAFTTLLIQGLSDEGSAMVFFVNNYDGPGTYSLDFGEDSDGTSGLYTSGTDAWSSNGGTGGTGTLTIDDEDAIEISGRFEFVGVDANNEASSRTITNGVFRAQFETE